MSFLVLMRPARSGIEEQREMLDAHWAYLREQHAAGRLLVAGPSWDGDDPFGIGVVDTRDRAEVEALVAADPGVTSGWLVPEIRSLWIVAGR